MAHPGLRAMSRRKSRAVQGLLAQISHIYTRAADSSGNQNPHPTRSTVPSGCSSDIEKKLVRKCPKPQSPWPGKVDLGVFGTAGCTWDVPMEQERMEGIVTME